MVTRTQFDGQTQIQPGTVVRSDMNTATSGSAVITKVIVTSGGAITLKTSSGADSGTGDVTLTDNAVQYGAQTLTAAQQSQVQTNVGLGTMSTQAASKVAVTGGAVDGTTIGATTPAAVTATWLTFSGSNANYNGANSNAPSAPANGQSQFGWNYSTGAGELDLFINRGNGNGGGLYVYDYPTGGGTLTLLMSVTGAGAGYFPSLTLGAALPVASGGTGGTTAAAARANLGISCDIPDGRITLTSATPVMTAAVSAATSVIYTPYTGNSVPVWNGSTFVPGTFAEVSQAMSDTSKSPAAGAASQVYDIFGWMDGTTFRATRGPTWAAGATAGSNTARGTGAGSTALTRVQGVLVNQYAITNGPAAGYGVYLGTVATDSSGATVSYSLGSSAAGGGASTLNVWNYYNRVLAMPAVRDSTATHTYKTAGWQAFDASAKNAIALVRGVSEDLVNVRLTTRFGVAAANGAGSLGIGLDSSTALAAASSQGYAALTATTAYGMLNAEFSGDPGIGAHTLYAIEYGDGTNANTFYGSPYMLLSGVFQL